MTRRGQGNLELPEFGSAGEAAERKAAKQRILELADSERIPVEDTARAVPDRRWRNA
ncbi:hypothetical protein IW249_005392 [Micromonospora vinacea]|uniref:Transposase n=1 Tax=Micromonospora vinacea TaxID=709878 RepID=A0ABS0KA40_9ACTN|nr:hypothetical protein [Micromonospora vinacea]